jgi:chemosensory pili system protein ChpA (sensor histidine kinase/response regulator)
MSESELVLIVDDDPVVRALLGMLLARHGYRVAQATSGTDALSYLSLNSPPSLIFLDMLMPLMDGWNFLSHFRLTIAWAAIPVVIITSMDVATQEWAESLGAVGFLKKPFDEHDLMTILLASVRADVSNAATTSVDRRAGCE